MSVIYTKTEAQAIIRAKLEEGLISGGSYHHATNIRKIREDPERPAANKAADIAAFGPNAEAKRCAVGWLLPEKVCIAIQDRPYGTVYKYATDLVMAGDIVISDMDPHAAGIWLKDVQQAVDMASTVPTDADKDKILQRLAA